MFDRRYSIPEPFTPIPHEPNNNLFRIATLNVHQWRDNKRAILQLLAPFHLDVLGLEEVQYYPESTSDYLTHVANCLNTPHISFAQAALYTGFGNAILSRYPFVDKKAMQATFGFTEVRSMTTTTVQPQHPFLEEHDILFHCLHLDVDKEDLRLEQLNQMKQHFNKEKLEIVMGDFNAIDENDYTDEYLEVNIRRRRRRVGLEEPTSECINLMKEQGFIDIWRRVNPELKNVSSCRYGTRIDFIWMRGELKTGWRVKSCEIVPAKDATDHELVVCVFEKKE
jgi:exonuclease III